MSEILNFAGKWLGLGNWHVRYGRKLSGRKIRGFRWIVLVRGRFQPNWVTCSPSGRRSNRAAHCAKLARLGQATRPVVRNAI